MSSSGQNHQTTWRLVIWDAAGELLLSRPVETRTLVVSGSDDADILLARLGGEAVFLRLTPQGGTIYAPSEGGKNREITLAPGAVVAAVGLTWLLVRANATTSLVHEQASHDDDTTPAGELLQALVPWLGKPMVGTIDLRNGVHEFLSLVVNRTSALHGMLVLATGKTGQQAFTLASAFGLLPREAQQIWERMPAALAEDVLRHRARVLLPEELRQKGRNGGDSTVFLKGVRSVAGFPVLAEGRLVAVFYLGFENLLRDLTPELQAALEAAASVLGLVIQRAQLREQVEHLKLRETSAAAGSLPQGRLMVGSSPTLVKVYEMIGRLAPVDVAVLITGETGTGKELAAKEIHRLSPRREAPFVVVNAAALPENLIESELFGHKKGAFTGALSDRVGLVEQADGGTLFIDEIGELPPSLQAKLLRVLQEYVVTRVGEGEPRPVNFRLVTATHRSLEEMVQAGTFREDLFYRIAGAQVRMPSLRERDGDVLVLANYFRRLFAERHGLADKEWSQDALQALASFAWPGNIRELENVVGRAFVLAEGPVIRRKDLGFRAGATADGGDVEADRDEIEDVDGDFNAAREHWTKTFLTRALKKHKGHRADTARALGIGERTLFRYLEQLGMREP